MATKNPKKNPGTVLKAAEFKTSALAVMRRVHETGEAVTVTSRGRPLVRIEPARASKPAREGRGCMKGTVHWIAAPPEPGDGSEWGTLEEWDEMHSAKAPS